MLTITLPDGKGLEFDGPITGLAVAEAIGPGLAKAALAIVVNGETRDLSRTIDSDAKVSIITERDDAGLEIIRHSCAHLLAQAVQRIFPHAQVTIGPVIEDGFYYDFAFERPFTPEDLEQIEAEMQKIVDENLTVTRHEISREDAIQRFSAMGEDYKVQIIEAIPAGEILSFYEQGDFIDLCRGPHIPRTSCLKAFKLTKVAGAYWRGDSNNEMLQRIYGTAWANKKDLKAYLRRLEEAEKRDHRKLAKKYDLFHIQEEAPGMIFWHDKGWTVYRIVMDDIRQRISRLGYQEVHTPSLVDRSLWEASGHWEKFHEEMFVLNADEDNVYAVKPMNCPCHVQIFNQGLKSYRDLPLRMAEFGSCHRNEPSGALHGLMRLRNFVQDDAHIFCTEAQIQSEVASFIQLVFEVYRDYGFNEVILKLSTRPEKRVGSDESWDKAEDALKTALDRTGKDWTLCPGEGAFYGPKIEFSLKDCIGRVWQCGTIQVDFSMPGRLGAEYVSEDNSRQVPVMLHRAVLGSIERFIGILIEEFAGALPLWLAPVQVSVMTITDKQRDYATQVAEKLADRGIRVETDLRNEKIGFKIREHTIQRVPYMVILGEKEEEQGQVAVRSREGVDLGSLGFEEFVDRLETESLNRGRSSGEG